MESTRAPIGPGLTDSVRTLLSHGLGLKRIAQATGAGIATIRTRMKVNGLKPSPVNARRTAHLGRWRESGGMARRTAARLAAEAEFVERHGLPRGHHPLAVKVVQLLAAVPLTSRQLAEGIGRPAATSHEAYGKFCIRGRRGENVLVRLKADGWVTMTPRGRIAPLWSLTPKAVDVLAAAANARLDDGTR